MDDFLYALKAELMGNLKPDQIDFQIDLYRNYIIEEMNNGKAIDQVMRKLGDPSKIAELILKSYAEGKDPNEKKSIWDERTPDEINAMIQNPERGIQAKFDPKTGWDVRLGKLKLNSWYGTFIILGIVLVIFVILSTIFPGLRVG